MGVELAVKVLLLLDLLGVHLMQLQLRNQSRCWQTVAREALGETVLTFNVFTAWLKEQIE